MRFKKWFQSVQRKRGTENIKLGSCLKWGKLDLYYVPPTMLDVLYNSFSFISSYKCCMVDIIVTILIHEKSGPKKV